MVVHTCPGYAGTSVSRELVDGRDTDVPAYPGHVWTPIRRYTDETVHFTIGYIFLNTRNLH